MLTERELDDRDLACRARRICNLEQRIRNEGHFPVRRCPRGGCSACLESAIWERASERVAARIEAIFAGMPRIKARLKPVARTRLQDEEGRP